MQLRIAHQLNVLQSDLDWTLKWPFCGLSDLDLVNQKVKLNHLAKGFFVFLFRSLSISREARGRTRQGSPSGNRQLKTIRPDITWVLISCHCWVHRISFHVRYLLIYIWFIFMVNVVGKYTISYRTWILWGSWSFHWRSSFWEQRGDCDSSVFSWLQVLKDTKDVI